MRFLLAAGSNSHGQLGNGNTADQHTWTSVLPGISVESVAAGATHTLFLTSTSQVLGCGDNSFGQLGIGNPHLTEPVNLFADIPDVFAIAAAWQSSYVCTNDNHAQDVLIHAYGSQEFGLLGFAPLKTAPSRNLITRDAATLKAITTSPRHVLLLEQVDAVMFRVVGWGASRKGQLPPSKDIAVTPTVLTTLSSNVVLEIGATLHSTVWLETNGEGQTVLRSTWRDAQRIVRVRPTEKTKTLVCSWRHVFILDQDAHPINLIRYSADLADEALFTLPRSIVKVPEIVAGSEHVLLSVQTDEGDFQVLGYGWNEHGNMGLGHLDSLDVPTVVHSSKLQKSPYKVFAGNGTSWIGCDES